MTHYVNSRYYGYSMEEPYGLTFSPMMDEEEAKKFRELVLEHIKDGISQALEDIRTERKPECQQ